MCFRCVTNIYITNWLMIAGGGTHCTGILFFNCLSLHCLTTRRLFTNVPLKGEGGGVMIFVDGDS